MKRPYQTPYSFQLKLWLLILGIMIAIMLILAEKNIAQEMTHENMRSSFLEHLTNGVYFTFKSIKQTVIPG
jgi:uncharacterized membrane protein